VKDTGLSVSVCSVKKMSLKGSVGSKLLDWRKRAVVSSDLLCLMIQEGTLEVTLGMIGGNHIMMTDEAVVAVMSHHHLLADRLLMTAALSEEEEEVAVGIQVHPPLLLIPHLQEVEAVAVIAIIT